MNSRRITIVVAVIAVIAVVALGGFAVYQTFLSGDNVPALGLDTPGPSSAAQASPTTGEPVASPTAGQPAASGGAPSPSAGASTAGPGTGGGTDDLAGTWTVASGVAGYRVRETFLQQNAETDAVGRTEGVTGTLAVSGSPGGLSLDSASLAVDMTTLASDRDRRDGQLKGRAIETDRFPTSTFELAGPVALPADFGGSDVAVTLPGKLTLHGVTKDVEIAAQARREADGSVVIAGSLPVLFSDYGIEAPNVAGIIAVQDRGTMEFRVVLAKG